MVGSNHHSHTVGVIECPWTDFIHSGSSYPLFWQLNSVTFFCRKASIFYRPSIFPVRSCLHMKHSLLKYFTLWKSNSMLQLSSWSLSICTSVVWYMSNCSLVSSLPSFKSKVTPWVLGCLETGLELMKYLGRVLWIIKDILPEQLQVSIPSGPRR